MGIWRNTLKTIITNQHDRIGRWVCERTGGTFSGVDAVCIGLECEGNIIAGVIFDHYNGVSIAAHIAFEGKLTKEFIRFGFSYPFNQLKVKKIIGLVEESNIKARKLDEHFGYILETRIKDACNGGDLLIYTMTKEQCRFLKD